MRVVFLMIFFLSNSWGYELWTWTYHHETEKSNMKHQSAVFSKEHTPLFNQLICSWNCLKPKRGYFSFFVQVRHEKTGNWSDFIHMADWGAGVKKTYLHKELGLDYHYVRLELGDAHANGFRIKVVASPECDEICNTLQVCVSDLQKMKPEKAEDMRIQSCYIPKIPFLSQFHIDHPKNDALCSPTSCTMLLRYHLQHAYDPALVADTVYDEGLGVYGSWPCNMAGVYALSEGKLSACVTRLDNFQLLHRYLMRGIPVCVSVRGPLAGSATPYASGHILVVKGFDARTQEVVCNDPAFEQQDDRGTRYPLQEFLQAWERSKRLSYLILPIR